jgi:hypothetical protein
VVLKCFEAVLFTGKQLKNWDDYPDELILRRGNQPHLIAFLKAEGEICVARKKGCVSKLMTQESPFFFEQYVA